MPIVFGDAETFNVLDLQAVGALRYSRDRSLDLLCWSLCPDDGSRKAHVYEGLQDLQSVLPPGTPEDPTVVVHWGQFDRLVAEAKASPRSAMARNRPSLRPRWPQAIFYGDALCWLDLRQLAAQAGAPADVGHAAAWVGMEKLPRILTFSKPDDRGRRIYPHDDPDRWHRFVAYAARDAEVLPAILDKVLGGAGSPQNEPGWRVVERMNMRGFPIDLASVNRARAILAVEEPKLVETFARLTGGLKPTQAKKVAAFLGLPNCQKDTILDALLTMDRRKRRVAQIRLEAGSATRHKLIPLENFAGPDDNRARNQFSYYGAWTRRLTASGTQPQNFHGLPEKLRPAHVAFFDELKDWQRGVAIFDAVAQHIRGFVQAPPGKLLASVDFSQIELRVMAWLAGETWLLEALHAGTDVYRITAGSLYGSKPIEVTEEQRKLGKVVELASQFGLSAYGRDGEGGLYLRAKKNKIALSHLEAEHAINTYRKTHPKIVRFWQGMQDLLTRTVLRGGRHRLGRIVMEHTQPDLIRIIRPSGHYQCLWDPEFKGGEYRGQVEYTGRLKNGAMGRRTTYGSKLAQGIVQGTAADLLIEAMTIAEDAGYPPIMSVHDEIVAEVDDDGVDHASALGKLLSARQSEWSKGVPIVCDQWQAERFQ